MTTTATPAPPAIVTAVRRAVLGEFRRDSCIAATRVVIEVCAYFGIEASPVPVKVAAFTPIAWELRDSLVTQPSDTWPRGAWSAGVAGTSGTSRPGRWDGHLVATADHGGPWLLDASLDQLARPARGLVVEARAFPLPHGMPVPDADLSIKLPSGVVIVYGHLADEAWRDSPNWRAQGQAIRRVAGGAIRALRQA